ncbi:hypothetical protein NKG05_05755 [Oerskovia sp. M15]
MNDLSAAPDAPSPGTPAPLDRLGVVLGASAYFLWGAMPSSSHCSSGRAARDHRAPRGVEPALLAAPAPRDAPAPAYRAAFRSGRTVGLLAVAAVLVAVNWTVYVYGVLSGHVLDAALGYFINPSSPCCSRCSCSRSACDRHSGSPWGSGPRR